MDVFEHLALLMIIKKEVNDYVKRYQQKLSNIQRFKKVLTMTSDPGKLNLNLSNNL